jgi:hypothetical protein
LQGMLWTHCNQRHMTCSAPLATSLSKTYHTVDWASPTEAALGRVRRPQAAVGNQVAQQEVCQLVRLLHGYR